MKSTAELAREFSCKTCTTIDVEPDCLGRYTIYTPFMFEDGDHFVILLEKRKQGWMVTDAGHTFMHLNLSFLEVATATRADAIDRILAAYHVNQRDGILQLPISGEQYGEALWSFIQALVAIGGTAGMADGE